MFEESFRLAGYGLRKAKKEETMRENNPNLKF